MFVNWVLNIVSYNLQIRWRGKLLSDMRKGISFFFARELVAPVLGVLMIIVMIIVNQHISYCTVFKFNVLHRRGLKRECQKEDKKKQNKYINDMKNTEVHFKGQSTPKKQCLKGVC